VDRNRKKVVDNYNSESGCLVDGCEFKHHAGGYCSKHYIQIYRNGKISLTTNTTYSKKQVIQLAQFHTTLENFKMNFKTAYYHADRNDYLNELEFKNV